MSRLAPGLCALLVTLTPRPALPSPSNSLDYQRPEIHRHAINAVIGDTSYRVRFGTAPPPDADPALRVRTHLEFVHALLSKRDVSALPAALRAARAEHLEHLCEYIAAGRFPRNHLYPDQNRPCFIDGEGNICAVGYLVARSAGRRVAERINAAFQSEFLWRMRMPELDAWIAASGFSLLELSMIQPGYDPDFRLNVTPRSGGVPSSVRVYGYVLDEGYGCGIKFVAINFSDDVIWSSPILNSYYVPVDVTHTYTEPGSYAITAVAVATDWCGNEVVRKTWMVTLGLPSLPLAAVQLPGGPPYRISLRTSLPLDLHCMVSSTVDWGDGSSPSPESWWLEDGFYRTGTHQYAFQGWRQIVVTNTYRDGCVATQSGVLSVNVTAGVTLTAKTSTWGGVKALYR